MMVMDKKSHTHIQLQIMVFIVHSTVHISCSRYQYQMVIGQRSLFVQAVLVLNTVFQLLVCMTVLSCYEFVLSDFS